MPARLVYMILSPEIFRPFWLGFLYVEMPSLAAGATWRRYGCKQDAACTILTVTIVGERGASD